MTSPPQVFPSYKYDLTERQISIWISQKLHGDIPLFHVVFTFRIRGKLDQERFKIAFEKVVGSTDTLHTTIRENGEQKPIAEVLLKQQQGLVFMDRRKDPDFHADPTGQVEKFVWQPFRMDERLYKSWLIQLAEEDFLWVLAVHHIVTDGWSAKLIFDRVAAAYADPNSEFVSPSFGRISNHKKYQPRADDIAFWEEKKLFTPPEFSFYGRSPAGYAHPMERFTWQLDPQRMSMTLQGQEVASPAPSQYFDLLAAVYALYLAQLSSTTRTLLAMVYHGRQTAELKEIPGLFTQLLPLLVDVSPKDTLLTLGDKIRSERMQASRHSRVTLNNKDFNSLMQASINLHLPHFESFCGFSVEVDMLHNGWNEHSLAFNIHKFSNKQFVLSLDVSKDLIGSGQRKEAADRFWRLLTQVLDHPHRTAAQTSLLSKAESKKIFGSWNGSNQPNQHETISNQFEDLSASMPRNTAFIFNDEHLSYQTLNVGSNHLGRHLQMLPESEHPRIGICLNPSLFVPVALLAVIKIGRSFVMLPPDLSRKQRLEMLEDCGIKVVITTDDCVEAFNGFSGRLVRVDHDAEIIAGCPPENLKTPVNLDDELYVAYTSGSTGQPKGISIPQRQLLNMLASRRGAFPFKAGDVFCHKSYLGFVDSTIEFFEGLLAGAATVLLDEETVKDPERLTSEFARHKITIARFISEHLRTLIETIPDIRERFSHLRLIANTASSIRSTDLALFLKTFPEARFINTFGLSEVLSIAMIELSSSDKSSSRVPIGRPVPNRKVYILNGLMQPLPPGIPGELYVGGDDLPSNYIGDPRNNIDRFLPDPFLPGERIFRTGDIASWRLDGLIEYFGRKDDAVKIRGQLVNIHEIEHILGLHPDILQAAVVHFKNSNMSGIAAYTEAENKKPDLPGLRRYLADQLPEYKIPTIFQFLDKLPRKPNGKIDRQSLPQPDFRSILAGASYDAPKRGLEKRLAEIWEAVLLSGPVGRKHNFFDSGGNSLLAIRLITRIEAELGIRLPFTALTKAPILADQARLLMAPKPDASMKSKSKHLVPLANADSAATPLFFVHGFGGGVIGYTLLAQMLSPARPFYGLQASGMEDDGPMHTSITEMAAAYMGEIRKLQPKGPYYLGGYCYGGIVAFEIARRLEAEGEEVGHLALLEAFAPLRGPQRETLWDNPRLIINFINNLPFWFRDFLLLGLRGMWTRITVSTRRTMNRIFIGSGRDLSYRVRDLIEDDVDLIPERHQRLMEVHIRALMEYHSDVYGGVVHLYRVAGASLTRLADRQYGWGKLAERGVEIHFIDGTHRKVLEKPYVESLADALSQEIISAPAPPHES